ncbi:MAG: CoA ester lyase [Acidimicrobiaceae bacterium]|nr:CoA ester lyase [Acidimicrobiaceae bacterium]
MNFLRSNCVMANLFFPDQVFKSLLFAPGNKGAILSKLPRSSPDASIIDLEDSVPTDEKENAREIARALIPELNEKAEKMGLFVRVNALETAHFVEDLSNAISDALTGIIVPKISSREEANQVSKYLSDFGFENLPIMAGLETVSGLVNALEIAKHPQIKWCYFGAEDYVTDLGGVRRTDNREVLLARSQISQATRLAGIHAIDMVVSDFKDEKRFIEEAAEARSLGFTGKLCIHPDQVNLANKAFRPTEEELEWAQEVVKEFEKAIERGEASIAIGSEMIDEPIYKRAQTTIKMSRQ